ncbi:Alpha/Beta hydrolase protein [Gymnopilus junonius]|uniref:Alpha/Beta hydrolase protein n=1 Tax=Gymnopilus junonius TaxID=109634 RepID=A0A9P5NTQ0_GYMJU|nr:Alpha/Beta hydrolase protein [Gymnopilus junonius]
MSPAKIGKYGDVSLWERLHFATVWVRLPFVLLWTCFTNLLFYRNNFKRATAFRMVRWFGEKYSVAQTQYILPKSVEAYKIWAKANGLPITVEELEDGAAIMWIGPKRTDKVALYVHGGAYIAPLLDYPLAFWRYIKKELLKNDCDVGFAVLAYTLVPEAAYPTQLQQTIAAVDHLLSYGVHPSNLHLAGDSAGGHLILSLFSHILHPLEDIRKMTPLEAPIRSAYLMSPWVRMKSTAASFLSNSPEEIFSTFNVEHFAELFLANVPEDQRPYAEADAAPDGWFDGLDNVVDRILVTVGEKESFRDDILHFSQNISKIKSQFTFIIQDGAVHDDPMLDFLIKSPEDQLGSLTPQIVKWLSEGINASHVVQ